MRYSISLNISFCKALNNIFNLAQKSSTQNLELQAKPSTNQRPKLKTNYSVPLAQKNENNYSIQIVSIKIKQQYFLNTYYKKRQSLLRNCTNGTYTNQHFNHLATQNPVYTPGLYSTAQGEQQRHKKHCYVRPLSIQPNSVSSSDSRR